ncbi:MAG TPA: CDP-alcohol phosphatidyltransferase family protein [Bryobacteraceae bacterium]|nr:CDP-alcohol phosphatidyltransferase family protein [Bryobacteraceae bacterium]
MTRSAVSWIVPGWLNPANLFTLLRLVCIPFAVAAILRGEHGRALWIVLAAGLTDAIDGALARRFGMATAAGAYFDPIVDKLFLSCVYIALGAISSVPLWLVIEILARDLLILAGAGAAILFWKMRDFPPSAWGKASTFLQIAFSLAVMIGNAAPGSFAAVPARAGVWPVAVLTAFSGCHYLWITLRRSAPRVDRPPR